MKTYQSITELENKITNLIGRHVLVDFLNDGKLQIQIGRTYGLTLEEVELLESNFTNTSTLGRKNKFLVVDYKYYTQNGRITKIEA